MAFGTPLVMRRVSLPPPKRSAQLAEKPHSSSFQPKGDDQGVRTHVSRERLPDPKPGISASPPHWGFPTSKQRAEIGYPKHRHTEENNQNSPT